MLRRTNFAFLSQRYEKTKEMKRKIFFSLFLNESNFGKANVTKKFRV